MNSPSTGHVDLDALGNRLRKNHRKWHKMMTRRQVEAYRVYDHDMPEWPLRIDRYGQAAVVFVGAAPGRAVDQFLADEIGELALVTEVATALGTDAQATFVRRRQRDHGAKRYAQDEQQASYPLIVQEGACRWRVDLQRYHDTGLFLDHRPLRAVLAQDQRWANVLNLYCYTGTVSVAAARAGAKTTNVDLSQTYLNWAQENFKANDIDPADHEFVRADTMAWLETVQSQYDLIYVDPPTFSASKRTTSTFDVQRDHVAMLNRLQAWLKPDGLVVFSTNKRGFKLDADVGKRWQIKDVTKESMPDDCRSKRVCFELSRKGTLTQGLLAKN